VLARLGQFRAALEQIERALEVDPTYFESYHRRGEILLHLRRHPEAIRDFTLALEYHGQRAPGIYLQRAAAYQELGQLDLALADLEQHVKLVPNKAAGWAHLGICQLSLGHPDTALKHFKHAIQIDPSCSLAYYGRGNVHYKQLEYKLAVADFTMAISHNPNDAKVQLADSYANRCAARLALGELAEALADGERAVTLAPHSWPGLAYFGLALMRAKRAPEAIAMLRRARRVIPARLRPRIDALLLELGAR
jgi:tetratricopeptide (TPR) repeat protein